MNLSEAERRAGFARELDELVAKWGCTVVGVVRTERHGEQIQITPAVQIIVMEHWVDPSPPHEDKGAGKIARAIAAGWTVEDEGKENSDGEHYPRWVLFSPDGERFEDECTDSREAWALLPEDV